MCVSYPHWTNNDSEVILRVPNFTMNVRSLVVFVFCLLLVSVESIEPVSTLAAAATAGAAYFLYDQVK